MVLDRGNLLELVVPLLRLALDGLVRDSPWVVALATAAAASINPQLALLLSWLIGLPALRR